MVTVRASEESVEARLRSGLLACRCGGTMSAGTSSRINHFRSSFSRTGRSCQTARSSRTTYELLRRVPVRDAKALTVSTYRVACLLTYPVVRRNLSGGHIWSV